MKVPPRNADGFLADPPAAIAAILLYGPDAGLVGERAAALTRRLADDAADPFRVVELTTHRIDSDPACLADETQSLSLTGGRRVIRLRDAVDRLAATLKELLGGMDPALAVIVAEAGDLAPKSALRKLFESTASAAAIACYRDDDRTLAGLVDTTLAAFEVRAALAARAWLVENLGGDRLVSRGELEKLALYAGPGATVSRADAIACVGDSDALGLDDAALATFDGDPVALDRAVARLFDEGASPVGLLRAVQRHIQRLHRAAALVATGQPAAGALKTLRPPVFYQHRDRMARQLGRWSAGRLAVALDRLIDAEADCKQTGAPDRVIAWRALMTLAGSGGGHGPPGPAD